MTAEAPSRRRARGFEPWMISNVAIGMAIGSFLTLLVPPFITDVPGSAARVGIVFALISLAATVGPWFGGRADRSGRHRRYYLIAMIAVSGSFALLALASAASR
jgi:MFS family permease